MKIIMNNVKDKYGGKELLGSLEAQLLLHCSSHLISLHYIPSMYIEPGIQKQRLLIVWM